MDAPIEKVLYVLMDQDHRKEWVDRLYLNEILEQNGDFEYVLYQAFELPAIFSNRDYVYRGKITRDPATGVVELAMKSEEFAGAPETVGVRANLINSRYVLTPVDDTHTRIEVEIQTDPAGMMPAWLVNMIQKDWPLNTLNGVRRQLAQPYTATYPLPGVVEEPVETEEADPELAEETIDTSDTAAPAAAPPQ